MVDADLHVPTSWAHYFKTSERLRHSRCDDYSNGLEEQLHETLAAIEKGEAFDEDRLAKLDRLPRNRMKKYHRLRIHLRGKASSAVHLDPESPCFHLSEFESVRGKLPSEAWWVEQQLAEGAKYSELADSLCISENALKMRVHRWREAVRNPTG